MAPARACRYAHPASIDALAADFPHLQIVMAHPGWPWVEETIAVALHKGNVAWELSGWAPKSWSASFTRTRSAFLACSLPGLDGVVAFPPDYMERYRQRGYCEDRPLISHFLERFAVYAASLTLEDLVQFLASEEIAKHKLPERLEIMSEFPLSPIGKVSKKDLVLHVRR